MPSIDLPHGKGRIVDLSLNQKLKQTQQALPRHLSYFSATESSLVTVGAPEANIRSAPSS
jgi:hypothetical protein